jgi:TPR repeat protein
VSNQAEPRFDSNRLLVEAYATLETDPKRALVQLRSLADSGSAMSMLYLGSAYRDGNGTSVDLREAEQWFLRARAAGLVRAGYNLGRLYLDEKCFVVAREAFEIAASEGFVPAAHYLGKIYYLGWGVEKNAEKGKELLIQAADWGCVFAKGMLAYDLIHNGKSLLATAKGVLIKCSCYIDLFKILATEGFTSDRLR